MTAVIDFGHEKFGAQIELFLAFCIIKNSWKQKF